MKKPPKKLALAYLIWCALHLVLLFASWIDCGIDLFDSAFWPLSTHSVQVRDIVDARDICQYDFLELLIYCGLPVLIYYVWTKIEEKYYSDSK